jgi:hypothetical protein
VSGFSPVDLLAFVSASRFGERVNPFARVIFSPAGFPPVVPEDAIV